MKIEKENINKKLIETIKNYISNDENIISRLEDILGIGQQSIYRRLRDEIPFTFEEVMKIALELSFSIDEIIGKYHHKGTFLDMESYMKEEMDILEVYNEFIEKSVDMMHKMGNSSDATLISSRNNYPLSLLLRFENLTKFKYFKIRHLQEEDAQKIKYSDITLTLANRESMKKYLYYYRKINKIELIIDYNIFLSLLKEITYFYKRKLITDSELTVLQTELFELIDQIERIMSSGKNEEGSQIFCYLSTFNIETNYTYLHYDDKKLVKFWAYAEIPMIISDPKVCSLQKEWLDSLKKYSTLITGSNELQRIHYLDKQREYIKNIGQDSILSY